MNTPPHDELEPRRKRRKPGRPDNTPKMILAKKRQADAIALRLGGATLKQIAETVGYAGPTGAHAAIQAGLRDILPEEKRAEYRSLELARLDSLILAHWNGARSSDEDFEKHARIVMQAIGMRVKILGLEAPAQISVAVREGELLHVDLFQQLNAETLEALKPFQDEMVRISEMRAGAIDVQEIEEDA